MAIVARLSVLLLALLGCWQCAMAQAQPKIKVVVDTEFTLIFDASSRLEGIRHTWTFNDGYERMATEGLDTNNDGHFDPIELAGLARVNVNGLKEFSYFTHIRSGNNEIPTSLAADYWMEKKVDGRLTLQFALVLNPHLTLSGQDIEISVGDDTGFIEFHVVRQNALDINGGLPANCQLVAPSVRLQPPNSKGTIPKITTFGLNCASLVANAPPPPRYAERRVALVVAINKYLYVPPLDNPLNDAKAVAQTLRELGFSRVQEKYDVGLSALGTALKEFGDSAEGADWGVIYFAGHGIEVNGTNYLIPADAKLERSEHIEDEAVRLDRFIAKASSAKTLRVLIVDACRNNPFGARMVRGGATRSIGRGLAAISDTGGTYIAFAARDGQLAQDGEGSHSPFAAALLKHLMEPGIEIDRLFRKVRQSVSIATQGQQEPWTYGSLPDADFVFNSQAAR